MPMFRCRECSHEFSIEESEDVSSVCCPDCGGPVEQTDARPIIDDEDTGTWRPDSEGKGDAAASDEKYARIKSGDVLRGFRVEHMVGAGAMAVVYKATQLSLDRPVALKILPRKFSSNPVFVRQFDSETGLLASLNHP
ncbi:MAG: hypothetical protein QGI33_08135, partial [Candidatus Brocadiia bacterium]|nr:hypothetical protein [Candidatus Brocadiia bacterium]